MVTITYDLQASPQRPELKLDLEQERGRLRASLRVSQWGNYYFGVDFENQLEFWLFNDGKIEVRGKDENKCRGKIAEVQRRLVEIFGPLPYNDPAIRAVVLEDDFTADVTKVIPQQILEVMGDKMPDYGVRDVNFSFKKEATQEEASIKFERPLYEGGTSLPLRLTIIAPDLQKSKDILEGLRKQLNVKSE